jgi:hypothetical protein
MSNTRHPSVIHQSVPPVPVRPPVEVWQRPEMRAALAAHDIGAVFRLLAALGYSQQAIGVLTGHSQPEVSAISRGRRVRSYAVLSRIATGLGIPPGFLGLAWCDCEWCGLPGSGRQGAPEGG